MAINSNITNDVWVGSPITVSSLIETLPHQRPGWFLYPKGALEVNSCVNITVLV